MAQLNDWLTIDKASGTGNAEITLSASSYEELVERTATIKVQGINTNAILTVKQEAFVPTITITPSAITTDCVGSSVDIAITTNISLELVNYPDWIKVSNTYIPQGGTTNITLTIDKNMGDARTAIIDVVTFVKGDKIKEISIAQEALSYDVMGYVELIYETDEDNQTIKLFGTGEGETRKFGSYLNEQLDWFESRKSILVSDIIIDGVVQDWGTDDSFLIEKAGEHTVYVLFTDNIIKVNWRSAFTGKVGGTKTVHHQYPFWGNLNLKRARIPSIVSYGEEGSLFRECPRLESIEIGDESCMCEYMAHSSTALKTIKYPSTITKIPSYAFTNNAANVSYKNFVSDNITTIDMYAFANSNIVGDITDNNITTIGQGAFENCTSLDETVLDLRGITVYSSAFNNCTQYKEVIVDDNSNSKAFANIGGTVYVYCKEGYITYFIQDSKFTKVVMDINPETYNSAGWFENGCVEEVEFLNATPNWDYLFGETHIGAYFKNTPMLNKIVMHSLTAPLVYPKTFEGIGYNGTLIYPSDADYSSWLANDKLGYYGWNDIIVPNPYFNLSKTNVTIGKSSTHVAITLETNARWYIENDASWLSVSQNNGLQGTTIFDIVVSENNTSNTRMGSITIYSETGIEGGKITITQYNEYGDRLLYTSTTKDVVNLEINSATTAADGSAVSIISNTYDAENDIGTIIFDKDVSYLIAVFENASAITHITLPAMIKKIRYLEVGSVEELKLPPLLESIGSLTFRNSRIEKIYFGENFSKIDTDCFYIAPREMYFTTLTPPDCRTYSIGMSGYVGGRTTVYVPTEALDAYRGFRTHFYNSQVTITSITS